MEFYRVGLEVNTSATDKQPYDLPSVIEPIAVLWRILSHEVALARNHVALHELMARRDLTGEIPMKIINMKSLLFPSLAGVMLCASAALTSAQDVVIAPEQDTVIREYVKKKPLASISVPGVELNIGSTLPETVELHTFEDVPDVKYRYVVVDNKTVLVEPSTRKIVKVYE